jgi:hypothetical protein
MYKNTLSAVIIVLFFLTCANKSYSQEKKCPGCDCTISPFTNTCFPCCSQLLLDSASSSELKLILGLSDSLANKIANLNKTGGVKIFSDYKNHLSTDESKILTKAVNSLNETQIYYFNLPKKDRLDFAGDMDRILQQRKDLLKDKG